ncbi:MAG: hypothetical protein WC702_03160 [Patescibacteria group bacterium]|jgi:hypothetical protein
MAQILGKGLFKVMPWSMAAFLLLALTIGTWQVMPTRTVKAVAGAGTATIDVGTGSTDAYNTTYVGPSAAGTVTVGTQSYLKIAITIGAGGIVAAENNITVQINTNLFPANTWDTNEEAALTNIDTVGEWMPTYLDNGGATDNTAIAFTASAAVNTGLITIQATEQMDSGDVLTIWAAVKDSNYVRAAANVVIQTDDTGADNLTTIGTPPTIATAAAAANAEIVLANPVVGAAGDVTLSFTLPVSVDTDDKVVMTIPAYINIADVAVGSEDFGGGGTFSCSASTQTLTCSASDTVSAGSGSIIMTGITARYAGTTDITDFQIYDENTPANDIALDTTVAVTTVTAGVANASVVFSASVVSNTAVTTTITLTLPTDLDAADTVEITFPDYVNVSGAAYLSTTFLEGPSDFTACVPSSQKVTCTAGGVMGNGDGTEDILLSGIKFYYAGTDDITVLEVQDEGNDTDIIANDVTTGLTNVTAADAAATVVLLNNTTPSRVGTTTITLTVPFTLNVGDEVVITFPPFIDITGLSETATGTFDDDGGATIECDDAAQVLTCDVTAGTTGTTGTIILANITSSYAGVTDITSFVVEEGGTTSYNIASDTAVALTNTFISSSSGSGSSGGATAGNEPAVTITDLADQTGGDTATITWSTAGSGIDTVELGYSIDNGSTYTQIAYNVSKSLGTYSWSVPNIDASDVLVKITAYDTGKANLDTDVTEAFDITSTTDEAVVEILDNTELDSEGRMVANNSGENGLSPVTGLAQEISEVREGWFIRSNYFNTVYFIDSEGRHPFWDANSFFSYADSFDIVIWVTDATLPTLPLASPIMPQPGSVLVKIQSDAKTYAIDDGNVLRWVPSEATAEALYGADWADYIIDLEPTTFARFTVGDNMSTSDEVDMSIMQTRVELAELAQ